MPPHNGIQLFEMPCWHTASGTSTAVPFAVMQWWFDASAKALGEGYRLEVTGTIQEMDYKGLVPGDFAVTTNGVHIPAYAGDGKWIQADPGTGAAATLDGRTEDNTCHNPSMATPRTTVKR